MFINSQEPGNQPKKGKQNLALGRVKNIEKLKGQLRELAAFDHMRLESLPNTKRLVQSVTTKALVRQLTCLLRRIIATVSIPLYQY